MKYAVSMCQKRDRTAAPAVDRTRPRPGPCRAPVRRPRGSRRVGAPRRPAATTRSTRAAPPAAAGRAGRCARGRSLGADVRDGRVRWSISRSTRSASSRLCGTLASPTSSTRPPPVAVSRAARCAPPSTPLSLDHHVGALRHEFPHRFGVVRADQTGLGRAELPGGLEAAGVDVHGDHRPGVAGQSGQDERAHGAGAEQHDRVTGPHAGARHRVQADRQRLSQRGIVVGAAVRNRAQGRRRDRHELGQRAVGGQAEGAVALAQVGAAPAAAHAVPAGDTGATGHALAAPRSAPAPVSTTVPMNSWPRTVGPTCPLPGWRSVSGTIIGPLVYSVTSVPHRPL